MKARVKKQAMPHSERGTATVELISGLVLTLAATGCIAWSIWLQTLQIYLNDLSQETAQMGALRLPGSSERQFKAWVERIKEDVTTQIEAFPGGSLFRSVNGGVRVRIEHSVQDSAVVANLYVCRHRQGFFFSPLNQPELFSSSRDCLGQYTGSENTSHQEKREPKAPDGDRLWISAHSVFPHPYSLTIYRAGIPDLPELESRARLHQIFKQQKLLFKPAGTLLREGPSL